MEVVGGSIPTCAASTDTAAAVCTFSVGEKVYFAGLDQIFRSGDRLTYGAEGEVTRSEAIVGTEPCLAVLFAGNSASLECKLSELRNSPPKLPGGYSVAEQVYFLGASNPCPHSGLVHGMEGSVVGPSGSEGRVCVQFSGLSLRTDCKASSLSRTEPPPLPDGFSLGETVFYVGLSHACSHSLAHGAQGVVMGYAVPSS